MKPKLLTKFSKDVYKLDATVVRMCPSSKIIWVRISNSEIAKFNLDEEIESWDENKPKSPEDIFLVYSSYGSITDFQVCISDIEVMALTEKGSFQYKIKDFIKIFEIPTSDSIRWQKCCGIADSNQIDNEKKETKRNKSYLGGLLLNKKNENNGEHKKKIRNTNNLKKKKLDILNSLNLHHKENYRKLKKNKNNRLKKFKANISVDAIKIQNHLIDKVKKDQDKTYSVEIKERNNSIQRSNSQKSFTGIGSLTQPAYMSYHVINSSNNLDTEEEILPIFKPATIIRSQNLIDLNNTSRNMDLGNKDITSFQDDLSFSTPGDLEIKKKGLKKIKHIKNPKNKFKNSSNQRGRNSFCSIPMKSEKKREDNVLIDSENDSKDNEILEHKSLFEMEIEESSSAEDNYILPKSNEDVYVVVKSFDYKKENNNHMFTLIRIEKEREKDPSILSSTNLKLFKFDEDPISDLTIIWDADGYLTIFGMGFNSNALFRIEVSPFISRGAIRMWLNYTIITKKKVASFIPQQSSNRKFWILQKDSKSILEISFY